jgi:adenosylcobinamide-GDP ribazoletransferase
VVGHVLGRWSTLPQSALLPPARPDGSGSLVRASPPVTMVGTLAAAVATLAVAGPTAGAAAIGVALAGTTLGAWIAMRALGGVSGDTYGAVNKLVELAVYAALAAMWA